MNGSEADLLGSFAIRRRWRRPLWLQLAGIACLAGIATSSSAQDVNVHVEKRGELVVIDVKVPVAASVPDVWAVVTDYEHMASFLSDVKTSRVIRQQGNALEVAQSGQTTVAFMKFSFAVIRAVELQAPHEIRSHLISGDFKSYEATTRLVEQPSGTLIVHHGEYVPKAWLPPMIGPSVVESQTRKQYGEMIAEILRRKAASRSKE